MIWPLLWPWILMAVFAVMGLLILGLVVRDIVNGVTVVIAKEREDG